MLPDLERKLLRILYNYSMQHRTVPSMELLMVKTGRAKEAIDAALVSLESKNYIEWPDKAQLQSVIIRKAWEQPLGSERSVRSTDSVKYWTEY